MNKGKVVAVVLPPPDNSIINTNEAYTKLIELLTKHPIGTVQEVMDWKNEGRR